jgi:hypothetical protein
MIDTATIFFSTLMCLFVVFRAIKLDGQVPWFGKKPVDTKRAEPDEWDGTFAESWSDRDAP